MISPRDFCYLEQAMLKNDGTICSTVVPIEDARAPPTKTIVRGRILLGGWILKPYKEGMTLATYVTMADLAGKIPVMIQNMGAKDQAMTVKLFADAYAKRYLGKSK